MNIPWIHHVFLSAASDTFEKTVCRFEDKCKIIGKLEQDTAKEMLLRFAAMRAAGERKVVPFVFGAGLPKKKYSTFIGNIEKAAGEDRASSLFYKKDDFTEEFAKKAEAASRLFFGPLNDITKDAEDDAV